MSWEAVCALIAFWALFGFQHSLLAQPPLKRLARRLFGDLFVDYAYRFVYFLSQCFIYPTFWYLVSHLESGPVLWSVPAPLLLPLGILGVFAHALLLGSMVRADINTFTGIKPFVILVVALIRGRRPEPVRVFGHNQLVISFPFNLVRHPLYLAIVLTFIAATPVYYERALLNLVCLLAYIEIGVHFEERQLIALFGDAYVNYRRGTPKYLPLPTFARVRSMLRA